MPVPGGYVQTGGALTTDTFGANGGPLASVYLSKKAVAGSVAIVAYRRSRRVENCRKGSMLERDSVTAPVTARPRSAAF